MVNLAKRFHNANWLKNKGFAPQVFLFRNLESGQVLYSQLPYYSDYQIKQQFQRPNWQNRLPSVRRDIWRIMSVASFESHEAAVEAFKGLVELKHMREKSLRKQAGSLRKLNQDGNIWFSAQYRPTYTQEAVSDLSTIIDEMQLSSKIYWENLWRKGDDKYWNTKLVKHSQLEKFNPRDESIILKQLNQKVMADFLKASVIEQEQDQTPQQ